MERYTERTPSGEVRFKENVTSLTTGMWAVSKRLAHYEEAECDGRMLILPVPEGTEVWCIGSCGELCDNWNLECCDCTEHEIVFCTSFDRNMIEQWNKTVFATEAEAKKILIEKEGKQNG